MAVQIWKHRARFSADIDNLLEIGATMVAPGQFKADVAGDCLNPQDVTVSYTDQRRSKFRTWRGNVDYKVPCRRCAKCLERRRRYWMQRIMTELRQADRSWFGTLTLEPQQQYLASLRAQLAVERRGHKWSELTEHEKFVARVAAIGPDISLWLKRVRKNSGAMVRYCLVAEAHRSGDPHFHVVVHHRATPVRHKHLKDAWRLGFSDFKLVDEKRKVAGYVAKYLTKSRGSKVRASARYGYLTLSSIGPKVREKETSPHKPHPEGHCQQCGSMLERLYGHYVEEDGKGVSLSSGHWGERLSNEPPRSSAPGRAEPARARHTSYAGESSIALPASTGSRSVSQGAAAQVAAGSGGAQPPSSDQSALSQSAFAEAIALWQEGIWVCPRGCVSEAPLPYLEGPPTAGQRLASALGFRDQSRSES